MSATQILVVEDERLVAAAIQNELEQFGYHVSGVASSAAEAVEQATSAKPDLVLMDIHLEGAEDGIDAARKIHREHGIPIIYLSAFSDAQTVRRASETEAFGYLIKPYEERELQTTIEMALAKHRAERHLEETRRWLAAVNNGIRDAVVAIGPDDQIRFMNDATEKLCEWSSDEATGEHVAKVCSLRTESGAPVLERLIAKVARQRATVELPSATWIVSRHGHSVPVEGSLSPIYDARDECLGTVLTLRDIRSRLELERATRQIEERKHRAQKMDAVSRVAGGMATHLNDLLTAILGNTSLALSTFADDAANRERELLERVEIAAHQAATLVQRFMMFSKLSGKPGGPLHPLDLGRLMSEALNDVRLRVDDRITVSYKTNPQVWPVAVDELLFGQSILELALNAQDAMPQGGQLSFELDNVVIASADASNHPDGSAGEFVRVRITDTGCGMSPAVLARIFDPCFTTKELGQAAGLGLTLVVSFLEQQHGWVECSSHVNQGAQFDLYLPKYGASANEATGTAISKPQGATPTILLCEADPLVREVGRRILEEHGYGVLLAEDGRQAIAAYQESDRQVDLAILDLNTPRLTAYAVLEQLMEIDANVRVLFSGGYFVEDFTESGGHMLGVLAKPYRQDELVSMVARALAARDASSTKRAT